MFDLSEVSPHWSGARIESIREPLIAGIARLRTETVGQAILGFVLVHEVDYDGMLKSADRFAAYPDRTAADRAQIALLDQAEQKILASGDGWFRASDNILPPEMLPATLNIVPGRFGHQFVGRSFRRGNDYDSIHVRLMRLSRENGDLVDQLLSLDGLTNPIVNGLTELGESPTPEPPPGRG